MLKRMQTNREALLRPNRQRPSWVCQTVRLLEDHWIIVAASISLLFTTFLEICSYDSYHQQLNILVFLTLKTSKNAETWELVKLCPFSRKLQVSSYGNLGNLRKPTRTSRIWAIYREKSSWVSRFPVRKFPGIQKRPKREAFCMNFWWREIIDSESNRQ